MNVVFEYLATITEYLGPAAVVSAELILVIAQQAEQVVLLRHEVTGLVTQGKAFGGLVAFVFGVEYVAEDVMAPAVGGLVHIEFGIDNRGLRITAGDGGTELGLTRPGKRRLSADGCQPQSHTDS